MGEKDKAMAYWFMKMKQGAGGEDFARDLWQEDHLVGVMFGTWRIDHVLDEEGKKPDPGKLTAEVIDKKSPQAKGIDKGRDFKIV
jgi:hypothetical protein